MKAEDESGKVTIKLYKKEQKLNIQNGIIEFKDYNECLEYLKN